jgi:hypothetical protein
LEVVVVVVVVMAAAAVGMEVGLNVIKCRHRKFDCLYFFDPLVKSISILKRTDLPQI